MTKVSFTTQAGASRFLRRVDDGLEVDAAGLAGSSSRAYRAVDALPPSARPSAQSAMPMRAGRAALPPGHRNEARRDMTSADLRDARKDTRKRGNEARRHPADFDADVDTLRDMN
jgi:hypothetical protein